MGKKIRNSRKRKLPEEISKDLTEKQKLFCYLFTTDKDCFGNTTKAYRTAFNCTYDSAKANGARLITNDSIIAYINKLLDDSFSEKEADRALSSVMRQTKDLPSRVAAIREFNKLKQRITEKTDVTSGGEPIKSINYIVPVK